jgi:NhaP-type Na+/H+ and K+/H+ antiporter
MRVPVEEQREGSSQSRLPPLPEKQLFFDGFTLNGSTSLESIATFYRLKFPVSNPDMTVGDLLAHACYGVPSVGCKSVWGRAELVVREVVDGTIAKVGLRFLPAALSSRQRVRLTATQALGSHAPGRAVV